MISSLMQTNPQPPEWRLLNATLVLPDRLVEDGALHVRGGRIDAVGRSGGLPAFALTERLEEVFDQIVGMLQPHRRAEQVLRNGRFRAFRRSAVLDRALRPAETGGVQEELHARRDFDRAFPASANAK